MRNNLLRNDREVRLIEVTRIIKGANFRSEVAKVTLPTLPFTRGLSTTAVVFANVVVQQNNELPLPARHGHGGAATIIYEADASRGSLAASSRKDGNFVLCPL